MAQTLSTVTRYDEADGVPSSHISQLLQDRHGFMWFSTWNGLCRYDGYEFQTFKPAAGDGCHMTTDRIRDIGLRPDGNILCRVDNDYFLFDLTSYRFRDLTGKERQMASDSMMSYRQSLSIRTNGELRQRIMPTGLPMDDISFSMSDRQGNQWLLGNGCIYKVTQSMPHTRRLDITPSGEVKCLFEDSHHRYWVATKNDRTVRLYSTDNDELIGFLGPDGQLHRQYTSFGAAVYCIYESADGTMWLGTKPDGLYRLRHVATSQAAVDHFTNLPSGNVYHLAEDRTGRLWVATLGGGLCCVTDPHADGLQFATPRHYPSEGAKSVRFIHITKDGMLLAAMTDGLLVSEIQQDADNMRFVCHRRQPDRPESMSSSATMNIVEGADGRVYISTESGGINIIKADDLLAEQPAFQHLNSTSHQLPSDITLSLTPMEKGGLMAVGSQMLMLLDSTRHCRVLDARYFGANYRFGEARPLPLKGGRWLFGLMDGAFMTTTADMFRLADSPQLVLTGIAVQGIQRTSAAEVLDTLVLQPGERSVTVRFAALDYKAPERISYAFRLLTGSHGEDPSWNYIGHDRSATLLDLEPDTYRLEIRSTNADGEWSERVRILTVIVLPTFWESLWGRLLILLLITGTLVAIAYTCLYIRRIKRQQHETLEKYLALIEEKRDERSMLARQPVESTVAQQEQADGDPMLQRVMAYIEQNLSNSEANVGDMAQAAATSRSGLQRKLKQAMGITPQDLLREARIKSACRLLRHTDKSVAEVAYACGFSEPKYFSRCFRQSVGCSPTEYKNASE